MIDRQSTTATRPTIARTILFSFVLFGVSMSLLMLPIARSGAQTRRGASLRLEQTGAVKQWPSKAKRWALVIGVDQYRDGNISPLRGAANDADALSSALTQYAGFPSDQVIVLSTNSKEEDRQPTRINILRYLSNIASQVPADGLLLVSFSGHGTDRGGQAFLIPTDALLTDDISLLEQSAISVNYMHDRIRAAKIEQVVVLLDACRNDPGGRADAPNPLTTAYTRGFDFDVRNREVQAFATLYATAVGERAYEYTEKQQGYFTWAVVEGLKGAAANERGEVTLSSLVSYVQETVPKRVAIDLGASKRQKPFAVIDGYRANELVVAASGPARERKLQAIWRNKIGMEFVLVPPGKFMMGSTNGEQDEKPVHEVRLNYSFYLGRYEVTEAQCHEIMGADCPTWTQDGESPKWRDDQPWEHVVWESAQRFIQKLNGMNDGYIYRLPSEAEWEYACRAGTTGDYAGNLDDIAWYKKNSGDQHPLLEQKLANAFGLYDMKGGQNEWCEDIWHESYVGAPSDGSAWLSGGDPDVRVLRGSTWTDDASSARSAYRLPWEVNMGSLSLGIRVVAIARSL